MQEQLFNMLFNDDEVTWQTMIYELVRSEEMDPWDINLKTLSTRFLDMVKKLKKCDFRISGKIILAAAILLRLKSTKLLEQDIGQLNQLIAMSESDDEFYEEIEGEDHYGSSIDQDKFRLIPRTPQPRKRKVSVYDLVEALEKALEVKRRRVRFDIPETKVQVPEKTKDITEIITEIYGQIKTYFAAEKIKKMNFSELVGDDGRAGKVYAFMPLLYLDNQRRIDLFQEKHLSEIEISLAAGKSL